MLAADSTPLLLRHMMMPSPSSSFMLPGETRCFDLDDRLLSQRVPRAILCHTHAPSTLRELLDGGTSLVGQVLITPQGSVVQTVPIMQVTALAIDHESQRPFAELTCIARGSLKLAPLDGGCARIDPLVDDEGSSPDAGARQRLSAKFELCRSMAAKLSTFRGSQWNRDDAAHTILERPVESAIRQRRRDASYGLECLRQSGLDASQRSNWEAAASEVDELHVLTYLIDRLSPQQAQVRSSLHITDRKKRVLYAERRLRGISADLAAKLALEGWLDERCANGRE